MTVLNSSKLDKNNGYGKFTYSKLNLMDYFLENNYDTELYGYKIDPRNTSMKAYQDFLIFTFIKENIPPGSKILNIGGDYSRILKHFKNDYECWKIDKFEGSGKDPAKIKMDGIKLVLDYMGNFNKDLPDKYFDFVFSISAFENVKQDDPSVFQNILDDINRVSKDGAYNLHCFNIVVKDEYVWSNKLLTHFFQNSNPLNEFVHFDILKKDPEVYVMSEQYYNDNWKSSTNKSYKEFGKPLSYNVIWRKESDEEILLHKRKEELNRKQLAPYTITKSHDYLKKKPAYVFHHIIKCGGTSVHKELMKWFQIEWDFKAFDAQNENDFFKNEFMYNKYKYNTGNFSSDNCMVSHFNTEGSYLHQRYPELMISKDKFKIFAFVRDPLELAISLYYYKFQDDKEQLQKYKLRDFLEYHYNLLAFQFPCNKNNYKEVLDRYFFIGLVEKMQESFDKLADLTGKRRIKLPVANKSKKDTQVEELKKDMEFIKEFKKRNFIDYLVYDYCKEKYDKL